MIHLRLRQSGSPGSRNSGKADHLASKKNKPRARNRESQPKTVSRRAEYLRTSLHDANSREFAQSETTCPLASQAQPLSSRLTTLSGQSASASVARESRASPPHQPNATPRRNHDPHPHTRSASKRPTRPSSRSSQTFRPSATSTRTGRRTASTASS